MIRTPFNVPLEFFILLPTKFSVNLFLNAVIPPGNSDVSKMKNSKGTLKGVLIIIVSEDGKSYNANYQFDDENFKTAAKDALEKTLKGVEWKPGTLNGKPVASQLKLPITMNFE
jgi:hypothetical protein